MAKNDPEAGGRPDEHAVDQAGPIDVVRVPALPHDQQDRHDQADDADRQRQRVVRDARHEQHAEPDADEAADL